ncbi:transposase [Pseudomonas fluorescens]|uniref:transposase n=1 Tax=Pseudomonas fluorescens TaxID=294 RepID=UPI0012402EF7|nr:transposase [Pseudomonas fluorescens]
MRQRTSYPKPFKAQVVQECLQPGVSMASVALRHGINANLVRKWIPAYRCGFHAIRTPSPPTSGHPFHAHPDRQSERSDAGLHC